MMSVSIRRRGRKFAISMALFTGAVAFAIGCSPPDGDAGDAGDADGTDASDTSSEVALVDNEEWSRTGASDDPLPSHRPATVECPEDSTGNELLQGDQTLAIKTDRCNYYSGSQGLHEPVDKGDELAARIFHFDLTADSSATAHVAVLLEGAVVWEKAVEIPSDQEVLAPTWTAARDYEAGTSVTLHLHNHGANQWNFIHLVDRSGS